MKPEKDQKSRALIRRLVTRYRQPLRRDTVVLYGGARATVYGCDEILSYTPEQICLRLGKEELLLRGQTLFCVAFTGNAVTVKGKIFALEYPQRVQKKEDGI